MPSDSFAEVFSSSSSPAAIRSASALISSEPANVGPSAHGPILAANCGRRAVSKTRRNSASWVSPAGGASPSRSSPDTLPPRNRPSGPRGRDHGAGAECLGQQGQRPAGPGQQPGISVAARDWPGEDPHPLGWPRGPAPAERPGDTSERGSHIYPCPAAGCDAPHDQMQLGLRADQEPQQPVGCVPTVPGSASARGTPGTASGGALSR